MAIKLVEDCHFADLGSFYLLVDLGSLQIMVRTLQLKPVTQIKVKLLVETELH